MEINNTNNAPTKLISHNYYKGSKYGDNVIFVLNWNIPPEQGKLVF